MPANVAATSDSSVPGVQQYEYPIGPQPAGFKYNRLVAPIQPKVGITLPEGYGFKEELITGVPNYMLYGGALLGMIFLRSAMKRKG